MSYCPKPVCQCKTCTLNRKFYSGCNECAEHKFLQPVDNCTKIDNISVGQAELEEKISELVKKCGNEEQICLLYEKAKIEYKSNKLECSESYGRIYGMVMCYMGGR